MKEHLLKAYVKHTLLSIYYYDENANAKSIMARK